MAALPPCGGRGNRRRRPGPARAFGRGVPVLRALSGAASRASVALAATGRLSVFATVKTLAASRVLAAPSIGAILSGAASVPARAFARASATLRIAGASSARAAVKPRASASLAVGLAAAAYAVISTRVAASRRIWSSAHSAARLSGSLAGLAKGEAWAIMLSGTIDRIKTVLGVLPPNV